MPRKGARRTTRCVNPAHKHGIHCYKRCGCSCDTCREANADHARRQRRNAAYGRRPERHPVEPVTERLTLLRNEGWTFAEIADATGMSKKNVQRLIQRPGGWVTPETAARVLNVTTRPPKRDKSFVDATGTRRRIQGLAAQGWTLTALGARVGKDTQQMYAWTHATLITATNRDLIKQLYDELELTPPPPGVATRRALHAAAKHGWVPGLCWDDIDDPTEHPKGLPVAA